MNLTCIVGIQGENRVLIGGDSLGVAGDLKQERRDPKLFAGNHDIIYGYTTSFRMGQLLRYLFDPGLVDDENLDTWMVTTFSNKLRQCFKEHGFATVKDGAESGGTFIVGIRGKLYQVEEDYQIADPLQSYTAVGSGRVAAFGSLYTTAKLLDQFSNLTDLERAALALEAAISCVTSVGGPLKFIEARWDPKTRKTEVTYPSLERRELK